MPELPSTLPSVQERTDGTARAWCFTLNNPTIEDPGFLQLLVESTVFAKTIYYGCETGDSGTPHLQGIAIFTTPVRLGRIQRLFQKYNISSCHCTKCRNRSAAIEYCGKEDPDPIHLGDPFSGTPGKRVDLESACSALLEHRDMNVFKTDYAAIYVKYHRGFEKLLISDGHIPRTEPPDITWIYGPTGTGKTRSVFEEEDLNNLWLASSSLKWFDGYHGQDAVLIDDFRGNFCTFHSLLRYLDRYPMDVPIKGGFAHWNPKRIYITSSKHPSQIYDVDEDVNQLLRRITRIRYTGQAHGPPIEPTTFNLPNPQVSL